MAAAYSEALSIDFGTGGAQRALRSDEVAGWVPATNWVSVAGHFGSVTDLVTSIGNTTPTSVTWNANNLYQVQDASTGGAGGNYTMMYGYIDTSNTSVTEIQVNDIPERFAASGYDLIVYVDGSNGVHNRVGSYKLLVSGADPSMKFIKDGSGQSFTGSFIEADSSTPPATAAGGVQGNMVVFRNIKARDFTLQATGDLTQDFKRAPVNAIQIAKINDGLSDRQIFSFGFAHVNAPNADQYLVESPGMRKYSEWQTPPITYWGPTQNSVEGRLVYKFSLPEPATRISLKANDSSWDFNTEPGGFGRGCSALEVSRDGVNWISLRNSLDTRQWGVDWAFEGDLTQQLAGAVEVWVRMRFLCERAPNSSYTVTQFGRSSTSAQANVFELKAYAIERTQPPRFNTFMLQSFQAGSTTDIDNLQVIDLDTGAVVYSNDFTDASQATNGLNSFYFPQGGNNTTNFVVDGPKSRVVNGKLRLETTGFNANGSGGYNSHSEAEYTQLLPHNFLVEFEAFRLQWPGHFHFQVTYRDPSDAPSSHEPFGAYSSNRIAPYQLDVLRMGASGSWFQQYGLLTNAATTNGGWAASFPAPPGSLMQTHKLGISLSNNVARFYLNGTLLNSTVLVGYPNESLARALTIKSPTNALEIEMPAFTITGTAGTNLNGRINWTNALTGATGNLSAATNWSVNLPLAVGTNVFRFGADYITGKVLGIAYDSPDGEPYVGTGWGLFQNGGFGFGPWQLAGGQSAGHFLAQTSTNLSTGVPYGFGLWANNGATSSATRAFAQPLGIGDVFTIRIDNNRILTNGATGIALLDSNGISRFELQATTAGYSVNGQATGIGLVTTGLDLELRVGSNNTFDLKVVTADSVANSLSGEFLPGDTINSFRAFNRSAGTGSAYDFFLGAMSVTSMERAYATAESVPIVRIDRNDSDQDGLPDSVETGTGTFLGRYDTGTRPNMPDTSGDGILDGEAMAAGLDPNSNYRAVIDVVIHGAATNPGRFGLSDYASAEQNAAAQRLLGRDDVLSTPASFGLYNEHAIHDLNLGGLMLNFEGSQPKLRLQLETSDDLGHWTRGDVVEHTLPPPPPGKSFYRVQVLGPQAP